MVDMMTFPDSWEEFEKTYGFTDSDMVYTNGSRLIQSFRVKQWLDHIEPCEDAISREDARRAYNEAMDELVKGQMEELELGDFTECEFNTTECKLIARKIEALPSVAPSRPSGEWIPCEERLPSVYQKAVVCNIHGEMMIGAYTEFEWMFPCYFEKPIAWMPLPEPYKESE